MGCQNRCGIDGLVRYKPLYELCITAERKCSSNHPSEVDGLATKISQSWKVKCIEGQFVLLDTTRRHISINRWLTLEQRAQRR